MAKKPEKKSKADTLILGVILIVVAGFFGYKQFVEKQPAVDKINVVETQETPDASKASSSDDVEFLTYSRDNQYIAAQNLVGIFEGSFKTTLKTFNLTGDTLRDRVSLKTCETTSPQPLQIGLVDPFIYGCFQRKQKDLQLIYKQQSCQLSGFVISTQESGINQLSDLHEKNLLILGQSRAILLSKISFSQENSLKINQVAFNSNNKNNSALDTLRSKRSDALFVVGFKKGNAHSIPLINANSTEEFNSIYPDLKIIHTEDYPLPCYVMVANSKMAKYFTDENKATILNEINSHPELATLTESAQPLELANATEDETVIGTLVEKSLTNLINANTFIFHKASDGQNP